MSKLSQMLKPATKSIKTQDPVNFLTQLSKLILGGSGFEWPGIRISSPGILKTENNELFNHNGPIGTVGTTGNPAGVSFCPFQLRIHVLILFAGHHHEDTWTETYLIRNQYFSTD